jgi:succinate dehydrogenase/fumarate reductase flavoprotein subunit
MHRARNELSKLVEPVLEMDSVAAIEVRNLLLLALEVTTSALFRKESRGAHFRDDFPERDPELDYRHQVLQIETGGIARHFGPLRQETES